MVSTMEMGPTPGLMVPATQEALATTSEPYSFPLMSTNGCSDSCNMYSFKVPKDSQL